MALNYPGPYTIKFFYTTSVSSVALQHIAQYSLDLVAEPLPGDDFSTIEPVFPAGSSGGPFLDDVMNQWVLSFKALLSSGGGNTIDRAELWKNVPASFDSSFLSAMTLAVAGTSGSTVVSAGQAIVTMRTTAGGIAKFEIIESVIGANTTDAGTISNANLETMISDIEAGDYPWTGRDNGYPFVRIAHYPGINERLWKKRFRP